MGRPSPEGRGLRVDVLRLLAVTVNASVICGNETPTGSRFPDEWRNLHRNDNDTGSSIQPAVGRKHLCRD
jgi:hypothetical protein